ncbi:methyl-accepting chemotaxis protein [Aliidongia sp.]|uniref:methyl-accepting chemotaxis protein n=1 Tax=Aliidongia sp. TaxID=1914230 RepID=UPI0039C89237
MDASWKRAERAVGQAKTTDGTVRSLAESAQKIGAIVSLINNIASRTNLLALNATIEAALAVDAGKGFALLAAEVRSLGDPARESDVRYRTAGPGDSNETAPAVNAAGCFERPCAASNLASKRSRWAYPWSGAA